MKNLSLFFKILNEYSAPFNVLSLIFNKQKGYAIVKLKNSLSFLVRKENRDINTINEIFLEKIYSKYLKDIHFRKNPLIIDVGANIGTFSLLLASKLNNCKIYSLEPASESFFVLKTNIEINNLNNKIYPLNKAMSDKKGISYLTIYSGFDEANSIENIWNYKIKNKQEVETLSLSDLFKENKISFCDLLKLDCEGSEYKIIKDLDKVKDLIGAIIIEYHSGDHQVLLEKLKMANFNTWINPSGEKTGLIFAKKKK